MEEISYIECVDIKSFPKSLLYRLFKKDKFISLALPFLHFCKKGDICT